MLFKRLYTKKLKQESTVKKLSFRIQKYTTKS